MKPIAVIFSDLHLGEYSRFNKGNKRVLNHFKVLFHIRKICLKYDIPSLCLGDLFSKPDVMSNGFYELVVDKFNKLDKKRWVMYTISGNHDMNALNTFETRSPSWVNTFSKQFKFLECVDWQTVTMGKHFSITGIPYLDNNVKLNTHVKEASEKKLPNHILMLHTDYPGARDTDDTEVGDVQNLNVNLLNPFKMVLMGHIHKPQKLGKKLYMVGAPLQQRRTDKNCPLGYWLLYEDFTMKFFEFKKFPKFKDVSTEEEVLDDGNYYTVVATDIGQPSKNTNIKKGISKRRLVRNYMKTTNNEDKDKSRLLTNLLKKGEDGI